MFFSDTHLLNIIALLHYQAFQDMWVILHTPLLDSKTSVIIEANAEVRSDSLHPIQFDLKMQCIHWTLGVCCRISEEIWRLIVAVF